MWRSMSTSILPARIVLQTSREDIPELKTAVELMLRGHGLDDETAGQVVDGRPRASLTTDDLRVLCWTGETR